MGIPIDKQLRFWEEELRKAEKLMGDPGPEFREARYWKDVVPYKVMLRETRGRAGILVCWGALDCLDHPELLCASEKHEVCKTHGSTCVWCKGVEGGG